MHDLGQWDWSTNLVQTDISKTIGWIALKAGTDIRDPQRTHSTDFGDLLTFPLAPSWGWRLLFLYIFWQLDGLLYSSVHYSTTPPSCDWIADVLSVSISKKKTLPLICTWEPVNIFLCINDTFETVSIPMSNSHSYKHLNTFFWNSFIQGAVPHLFKLQTGHHIEFYRVLSMSVLFIYFFPPSSVGLGPDLAPKSIHASVS